MKSLILLCMVVSGCGGLFNFGDFEDGRDTEEHVYKDTSVKMDSEFQIGIDTGTQSEEIDSECDCVSMCKKFKFTECETEIIESIPNGKYLDGISCEDNCVKLIEIYSEMMEPLNCNCLERSESCYDVDICLEID